MSALRIRKRLLFVVVGIVAVLGALGYVWWLRAERQAALLHRIRMKGATVYYDAGDWSLIMAAQALVGHCTGSWDAIAYVHTIDARHRPVTGTDLAPLSRLKGRCYGEYIALHLEDTDIGAKDLRYLRNSRNIAVLRLDRCPVGDSALAELCGWTQLRKLSIEGTHCTDQGLRQLAQLPKLFWLDASGTDVTGAGFDAYTRHPALEYVYLRGCPVTLQGVEALSRVPRLAFLDLRHTSITDEHLVKLATCDSLRLIWVDGTRVTQAGIQRIQSEVLKRLPERHYEGLSVIWQEADESQE